MLAKRVIPCLDVDAGRVVKGTRFADLQDAGDPVELAARYDREGADELVFLDITATVEGRQATLDVISRTAEQVFIPLTVGGGVHDEDGVNALLRAGADKVSLNSAAVRDPAMFARCADRFGTQCMVVAIDARAAGRQLGGRRSTPGVRATGRDAIEWAVEATDVHGAGEILVTSMDRDGTGEGYDLELLARDHVGRERAGRGERRRRRPGALRRRRSTEAAPTRCSRRRGCTTGSSRSVRSRSTSPRGSSR